jgi:hypothetical protein
MWTAIIFVTCNSFDMYDILGIEQRQGDHDAAGSQESSSIRLHNDVHKVERQRDDINLFAILLLMRLGLVLWQSADVNLATMHFVPFA